MGFNYLDCKVGWKYIYVYFDVIICDELNLEVCGLGKVGLFEFVSLLLYLYLGNVVFIDDFGVIEESFCECGKVGKRFKVIGWVKKVEVRGCGDVMFEKLIKKLLYKLFF